MKIKKKITRKHNILNQKFAKINTTLVYFHMIFGVFFMLLNSCTQNTSKAKLDVTKENQKEENNNIIQLTALQIKSAGIVYGNLETKYLSEVINTNGYTKLPPQNQSDVSIFVGGIVKNILVIEGQYIKKGQTLASYQSLEYNNIKLQKAKLVEELQEAKIKKDFLEIDFQRQKELSEENITSKKAFQKTSSELLEYISKIKNTQIQIDIIDQNLMLTGNAPGSLLNIPAPISGYITSVNIKIGTNITPNTSLFSIVDNSKMHIDLLVYEKDLFKLNVGQTVRFTLTNQANKEITGRIFSIGKAFQNDSKSVAVHADINNTTAGLISGMYVNGLIDIGKNLVKTLPIEALAPIDGKDYIFISEPTAKQEQKSKSLYGFRAIEVKKGITQMGYVQIEPVETIPENARIVIKGAYYLQSTKTNSQEEEE